jgi:hypothetical protein
LDALADELVAKYRVTTPVLDDARISVEQQHAKVDISNDPSRMAYLLNPGKPSYVDGTISKHYIPFVGNSDVFGCRPSSYSNNSPQASVVSDELIFAYEDTRHDVERIRRAFASDLEDTKKLLASADTEIRIHNERVALTALEKLNERRAKLDRDRDVVEQLGYPLRRRVEATNTYRVPVVRKQIPIAPAPKLPLEPLPITDETYEEILRIINSMVLVMERSPNTFKGVDENFLRTLFLVTLNAQYEGQATGETFNYEGKTDILIRHENRNLFIGECKFWDGSQSLTDTVDQILRYAQWRDAKAAILLFSRNRDFTGVLQQIPEAVTAHPLFVRKHSYAHESAYRFTFRQKQDPQRFLTITVMAFNIPT